MLKNVAIPMMLSVVEGQTQEQYVKEGMKMDKAVPPPVFIADTTEACGPSDDKVSGPLATESTAQGKLELIQTDIAALIAADGAWTLAAVAR
jgi:hypothetical protein